MKFEQAETLERAFAQLKANGIKVDKARMDCGSYSQEVVEVTCCNCKTFYIRAMGCQTLEKRIAEIKEEEWQTTEINHQKCGQASLPFTAFFAERGYRLVVQRTLVEDKQSTLFDSYVYRCILTNDWVSDECKVSEKLVLDAAVYNPFMLRYGIVGQEIIPMRFSVGCAYVPARKLLVSLRMAKALPGAWEVDCRVITQPVPPLLLAADCCNSHLGLYVGWLCGRFLFSVQAAWYYRVSVSPQLGIGYF